MFNKELHPEAHKKAEELRSEFVVAVEGRVIQRQKANPDIATGEVEVMASKLHILNNSKTPPFQIEDEVTANEETRLRYRYLDLRRPKLHSNIALRHRVIVEIRKALDEIGFFEIETPMLTRSTPEGARDYLVPSRVHHGQFYALPQSPQIFKQILMICGHGSLLPDRANVFATRICARTASRSLRSWTWKCRFRRRQDIFEVIEHVMVRACAVAGREGEGAVPHILITRKRLTQYGSRQAGLALRHGIARRDAIFRGGARDAAYRRQRAGAGRAGRGGVFAQATGRAGAKKRRRWARAGVYTVKVTAEGMTSPLEKTLGAETLKKLAETLALRLAILIVATAAKEQIPQRILRPR